MIQRTVDSIPTTAVAVGAVSSPIWVTALDHVNTILGTILAFLGIVIAIQRIIRNANPKIVVVTTKEGADPVEVAKMVEKEIQKVAQKDE